MHLIDILIVAVFLIGLTLCAVLTKNLNTSVSDFLAANRCAGRYLITVSQGIAGIGAISIIAGFEMFYKAGFSAAWWQLMSICIVTFIFLSGWVYYRFRKTKALTMAQFIEMRYSRKLRIFTGIIAWLSGIINFGIFPSVTTRFFIHFCGLPNTFAIYAGLMAVLISIALFFTFLGGQITVITTDFIQGTFCNIIFVVVILFLCFKFDWSVVIDTISNVPKDESMLNPIKTTKTEGFNIWFYLIMGFNMLYGTGVWQGSQGYNACAINAHEARMGRTLSSWRMIATNLFMLIVAVCGYVFIKSSVFAEQSALAVVEISNINNPSLQEQITTSIAMKHFLPVGLLGFTAAVFLAAAISTDTTYLHSWGSIFIQDVIIPFSKKKRSPEQHLKMLKYSIFAVAIFIYFFSLIFRHTEYIYMFFMITGALYVGGGGAIIIGGLYWKKATTIGGWTGMIVGSTLSVLAIIIKQLASVWEFDNPVVSWIANQNSALLSFYAAVIAIISYSIVSLVTCKENFNLDKILNRETKDNSIEQSLNKRTKKLKLTRLIGITNEFNLKDKIIYITIMIWTTALIVIFLVGTVWNILFDVDDKYWICFWKYYILILIVMSVITTIWFAIGGFKDLTKMFKLLKTEITDDSDDGHVD